RPSLAARELRRIVDTMASMVCTPRAKRLASWSGGSVLSGMGTPAYKRAIVRDAIWQAGQVSGLWLSLLQDMGASRSGRECLGHGCGFRLFGGDREKRRGGEFVGNVGVHRSTSAPAPSLKAARNSLLPV